MFIFAVFIKFLLQWSARVNFATCKISQPQKFRNRPVAACTEGSPYETKRNSKVQVKKNLLYIDIYIYISKKKLVFENIKKKKKIATPPLFAAQFGFDHNLFIRTPFWVFLVPLESLESVESKYSHK